MQNSLCGGVEGIGYQLAPETPESRQLQQALSELSMRIYEAKAKIFGEQTVPTTLEQSKSAPASIVEDLIYQVRDMESMMRVINVQLRKL